MEQKKITESIIEIFNRKNIKITGVERVFSANETSSLMQTSFGRLLVVGSNMQVRKISIEQGVVELDGKIDSAKYVADGFKLNFFKKWFKK